MFRTRYVFAAICEAPRRGVNVNVFAYEGAVRLTNKAPEPHQNPMIGKQAIERPLYPQEDLAAMKAIGIARQSLVAEVELVSQKDLPEIFGRYDQVSDG